MENSSLTCPNYEKCPVFNGILEGKEYTANNYRAKYCNAGIAAWQSCKRYLVKEKTGQCPPHILPNSFQSVEEIIAGMK
ncbi:MAG: hypothetical protein JW717_01620 [Marinilabiliaceae bacterium]|nr:hypothetical protein [Marinilabiliaceae bacterium]